MRESPHGTIISLLDHPAGPAAGSENKNAREGITIELADVVTRGKAIQSENKNAREGITIWCLNVITQCGQLSLKTKMPARALPYI